MKTFTTIIFAIALAGVANAQSAKQTEGRAKALASAEQRAAVATCRVSWLRQGGTGGSSPSFFSHMAQCLSQSVSR